MLLKNNGFTLIEVLVAISIIFIVIQIVIPMNFLIKQERKIMSERRMIASLLQDEMQLFYEHNDQQLPFQFKKTQDQTQLQFTFFINDNFVQACVTWINVRSDEEKICYDTLEKQ